MGNARRRRNTDILRSIFALPGAVADITYLQRAGVRRVQAGNSETPCSISIDFVCRGCVIDLVWVVVIPDCAVQARQKKYSLSSIDIGAPEFSLLHLNRLQVSICGLY